MIITESFVFLNFPKTGSSFTRKTIKQLYAKYDNFPYKIAARFGLAPHRKMFELLLPILDARRDLDRKSQHGSYRQIPVEHRHKTIASITRNPFSRYVSAYLFRWWEKHPLAPVEQLKKIWPHFPDLSFREYYDMLHKFGREDRLNGITPKIDLGYQTIQFIQFYFPDPEYVLKIIDEDYIQQKCYLDVLAEITFLHQENLNDELYDFLLDLGYSPQKIEFIKGADKFNITSRKKEQMDMNSFYTPNLIKKIFKRDKLLFDFFPEYGKDFV